MHNEKNMDTNIHMEFLKLEFPTLGIHWEDNTMFIGRPKIAKVALS